jgi:hypothetical protein
MRSDARTFSSFSPQRATFSAHLGKISANLPFWAPKNFSDKEKLGRGRWRAAGRELRPADVPPFIGRLLWKLRLPVAVLLSIVLLIAFITGRKLAWNFVPWAEVELTKLFYSRVALVA